jgi:hypothetical protein
MAEKREVDTAQPPLSPTLGDNSPPSNDMNEPDAPKKRLNGGLEAWLSVLAGFCVFVNSWWVYFKSKCFFIVITITIGAS